MKFFKMCVVAILLVSMADAMPINSSARSCIPADTLQLISVDYRAIKDSPTAMALKTQLMPDNIKQFEAALKGIGIDPDKDVDTLAFASFRSGKQGVKGVGVASGPFNMKAVLKKMKLQKFTPKKYGTADVYPMDGGFIMTFLDDSTLLFGDSTGVHAALDTRDGKTLSLDTNGNLADMMSTVFKGYLMYKKNTAAGGEKVAMENTSADNDGNNVTIHFKSNDQQFQALMHTELFNALSH